MPNTNARVAPFYKILATEAGQEATILLYSYIGETMEWDDESGWQMGGVTDIAFVQELNRLAENHPVINIRINSPGGDFFHGNAIMTAIQNCKVEVHTWNDGICASMAADIWMCGKRRHMAKNALLMIHAAWNICWGNAKDMRACADTLDKINEAAIIATSASVGITEDEMRSRYYADYADHWLTYSDAQTDGLVNETGAYEAALVPAGAEKMSYKALVEHFEKSEHPDAPTVLDRLKGLWEKHILGITKHHTTNKTSPDMNLEELKKSLADGTLKLEDVEAHVATLKTPQEPPTQATAGDDLAAAVKSLTSDLATLKTQLTEADKKIAEYGGKPGASKASPNLTETDPPVEPQAPDALQDFNKKMADIAADNGSPVFVK